MEELHRQWSQGEIEPKKRRKSNKNTNPASKTAKHKEAKIELTKGDKVRRKGEGGLNRQKEGSGGTALGEEQDLQEVMVVS